MSLTANLTTVLANSLDSIDTVDTTEAEETLEYPQKLVLGALLVTLIIYVVTAAFASSKDKEDAVKVRNIRIQLITGDTQCLLSFFTESIVANFTLLVVKYVYYTLYVSMHHLSTTDNKL